MGIVFLRLVLILVALVIIVLCVPYTRRRLFDMARRKKLQELKQPIAIALLIYFLISVVMTLHNCSNPSVA